MTACGKIPLQVGFFDDGNLPLPIGRGYRRYQKAIAGVVNGGQENRPMASRPRVAPFISAPPTQAA